MAKGKWPKQTWVDAALRAIGRGGISAVAIDTLATELGATRGSFYWHFKDRRALLAAALQAWEELETDRVERAIAKIDDPTERMRTNFLIALADVADHRLPNVEPAVFNQIDDPMVADAVRRVSARRLDILTRGYVDIGMTPEKARLQAVLTYSTYLGWLQLHRIAADEVPEVSVTSEESRELVEHIIEQLIPRHDAPRTQGEADST